MQLKKYTEAKDDGSEQGPEGLLVREVEDTTASTSTPRELLKQQGFPTLRCS